MKRTGRIVTLLTLLIVAAATAQPRLEWSRTFGGQDEDRCFDMTETPGGGFLLVGYDKSFGHFNEDGWMVCLDANGDSLWSKEFGGDSWEFFFKVLPTDGGYYLLGRYASFEGHLGWDSPWLLKVNEDGEEIWSRTYRDANHGYVDTDLEFNRGSSLSMSGDAPHSDDLFLRKVNLEGFTLWERTYDDHGREERSYGHCQLADGGYIVCGEVRIQADNDEPDAVLIRTDGEGNQVWRHEYGGREFDALYDALQLPDGDIVAVGSNDNSAWLLHINGNGEVVSSHIYADNNRAYFTHLMLMEDGGFLLMGDRDGACLIRTDADGEQLWTLQPPESDNDSYYNSIVMTADGGFVVGYTSSTNSANFAIAKYGPDPALGWPLWNELPILEMNEDESVGLLDDSLWAHVEDSDNEAPNLSYTIGEGRHVSVEVEDGGFQLTPEQNWFGTDTLTLTVTDPDSHWAVTELLVQVASVNDLPLPFSLLNPEDGSMLNANQIAFIWDEASQNEFEQDSVRYRLILAVGDSQLVIRDIENTLFIFGEVDSLREIFGLEEGNWFTITWWIEAVDREGFTASTERWTISALAFQGVGPEDALPRRFHLASASPNPFNSSTIIRYGIPAAASVRLSLHDLTGREVRECVNRQVQAGEQSYTLNGAGLPAGVYLIRLEAGSNQAVRRIIFMP
jgi:hypothetical protein